MRNRSLAGAFVALASVVVSVGCANITYGPGPLVTPTPAVTSTPTAAPCTLTPSAGAQIVAMSPLITPTADPTYGIIGGYGLVSSGNVGNIAAPIVVSAGTTVQFFDNDQTGSQLRYSAAGIPNVSAFPSPTYTFAPTLAIQTGATIDGTSAWSTGLLAGQCYSQTLTVKSAGTFYFGDITYYGLGNIRDVIVAR